MALATRETPILLDEDEDDPITFPSGPSKLLVKRFTPIARALSLDGQLSSSSTYFWKNIGNDNAIVLDDTANFNTPRVPASLGGRLRASCDTMYKSVRLEADSLPISRSLKRKRGGEDLQSHGLPSLPLGSYEPTNSDPFGGLSKNQRKRLRKRLRSKGASAVQTTVPMSPMHDLISGFTSVPSSTSLGKTVPSIELPPFSPSTSDSDGVSIVDLPPRNGGPERSAYVGPNWPTHVKKCSSAFIPGPGLGPLAYGTSTPMNVHNATASGMPPNAYDSSACTIGKRVYSEPSSGRFPASEGLTVLHDPNRTLILEKLPKRFRSIDFIVQWCRDTAREDDPAPLYIDVARKLGKALIEFTTQEGAELAFNSPRLINADGRTQICAFWFRPDSPDRYASASLASGTSNQLSSAAGIVALQTGGPTQPVPSGCFDLAPPNEEQVTNAVIPSTSYARLIHKLPSTPTPISVDDAAEATGTGERPQGLYIVASSDHLDHKLDLRTEAEGKNANNDNDTYRRRLDEETDKFWLPVPKDMDCELKANSWKVSPSPSNDDISILQDGQETRILDQEQSSPNFEESDSLLVSSVPLSEEQEVALLLTEEDDEDMSFGGEGSPQLMYPTSDDRVFDSPPASGQQLTPKAFRITPPNSVLGGYVAAYESSPVRGESPETTKSGTGEPLVSSPVQNGPVRSMVLCNDEERPRTTRTKRTRTSKQAERQRRTYMTYSRLKDSLKAIDQRKRAGRLKAQRKKKSEVSTDSVASSLSSTDRDILMAGVEGAPERANRDVFTCSNAPQVIEMPKEDVTVDMDSTPVYIGRPSIFSINEDEPPSSDLTPLPSSLACASPRAETDRGLEDEREIPQVTGNDTLEIPQVPSNPKQHFPESLAAMPAAKRSALPSAFDIHGCSSLCLSRQEKRDEQPRPALQTPVRITRSKGAVKTWSKLVNESYIVVPVAEATGTSECVSANGPSSRSVAEAAKISAEGNAFEPDQNSQVLIARTYATGGTEVEKTAMPSIAMQPESSEDDPQQVQPLDMATVKDNAAIPVTESCTPETSTNVPVFSSLCDATLMALMESQRLARSRGSTADDQDENEAQVGPFPENRNKNVNGASAVLPVMTHTPVSNTNDVLLLSALSTASQPDKVCHDAGTQSYSPETNSLFFPNSLATTPPSSRTADYLRFVRSTSVVSDASNSGLNVFPVELEWTTDGGPLHPDSAVQNWSLRELQEGRRTVRFRHKLSSNKLRVSCEVIPPGQANPQVDNVISCIYREDTQDLWVTSVDLIRFLQGLVGEVFEVEEKNRLRRNFQSFKPLTVSKSSPDHGAFYQRIIQIPQPRPIAIEKDVKVFSWSEFVPIISKVFSKYSLLGPASSPPAQTSGGMNQPATSSTSTSHPFLAEAIEVQKSSCQPSNYQDRPVQHLTLLREHESDGGKQIAIATTLDPRDLTRINATSAPIPRKPSSPLLVDSSSGSTGSLSSSSELTSSSVTSLADIAPQRSTSYFDSLASAFLQNVLGPLQSDAPLVCQDEPAERANFTENVFESVPIDPMLLLLDRQNRLEEHVTKSKALLEQWEAAQNKLEKARIMALIKEERRRFEAKQTATDTEIKSMEARKLERNAVPLKTKKIRFKRWPQTRYDQPVIPLSDNECEDDELVADE